MLCANAASRILDQEDRIIHIVNNYSNISFNFGPTLLSWMERHDRDAYAGILEADRLSMERCGHGNALAQVYNHIIMPLATTRDKGNADHLGAGRFLHIVSTENPKASGWQRQLWIWKRWTSVPNMAFNLPSSLRDRLKLSDCTKATAGQKNT